MKNFIIIILLLLVLVMFVTNVKKGKQLIAETRKRIKHQFDLANLIESDIAGSATEENTTGVSNTDKITPPGNEDVTPSVQG